MGSCFDQYDLTRFSRGTLPPQLLLETLDSLQFILFPSVDDKSSRFLRDLMRGTKSEFDRDCLVYDGYIREMPDKFEYRYWGSRLAKLHYLVINPKPRHRFGRWAQRHTLERNALYLAILGLFLSAFFGFLSVVVGIVQTWVVYQAWKNPKNLSCTWGECAREKVDRPASPAYSHDLTQRHGY